tara:strand:+ start:397 stop:843 length:447 start_codon:yes stop_codon:yes gene_type:complete
MCDSARPFDNAFLKTISQIKPEIENIVNMSCTQLSCSMKPSCLNKGKYDGIATNMADVGTCPKICNGTLEEGGVRFDDEVLAIETATKNYQYLETLFDHNLNVDGIMYESLISDAIGSCMEACNDDSVVLARKCVFDANEQKYNCSNN